MKTLILLLTGLLTLSLSSFENGSTVNIACSRYLQDTLSALKLRDVCANFVPRQLNLTNSIVENVEFNNFLTNTDKQAISNSEDFDYFITLIILKQYQFQVTKYHQGYDLYTMRLGNAGFIVKSFVELAKLPADIKGINAEYVLQYIASNEKLKNEPLIIEIVNSISSLAK